MEGIELRIEERGEKQFYIFMDGSYLRRCFWDKELLECIINLINSKFKNEKEGFI